MFSAKKSEKANWLAIIGGVVVVFAVAAAAACFICKFMKKCREKELLEDDFDDCDFDELCECDEAEPCAACDTECDNN